MLVKTINNSSEFEELIKSKTLSVIHFYADWAAQCGPMSQVIEALAKQPAYKNVCFAKCEAEEMSEVSLQYKITSVPTFLVFKNGSLLNTVNGANPVELTKIINSHAGTSVSTPSVQSTDTIEDRLKSLISRADVMVFMKGNPAQPRCGFSKTLVAILNETGVPYQTFDILSDEMVRQELKKFSNWPTYPQIYVKNELVGGLDIIQELKAQGELMSTLKP